MRFEKVTQNKKSWLALLLLADEQESMIDCYLERGEMYLLDDNGVKAVCIVTDEGHGILELKNIAVDPSFQRMGYGTAMIKFLLERYRKSHRLLLVGTGESPATMLFYERCGFRYSHRIKNFFLDHYDHPIYDNGVILTDMIYLSRHI